MPVTDALLYLHGTGSSASGPITSTAKSLTGSIATTGVLTITAGAAGAALLVGDVLTGVNISAVTATNPPTVVTSITSISAINGVGTYVVSNPQLSNSATILATPPLMGDLIGVGGAAQESNLELDFGAPASGGSYPWLPEFPSLTEKGYTFPPEVVGDGGVEMGVHIIITAGCYPGTSTTGARVDVQSGAATGATTVIASRTFTNAQLEVAGAHYFIPVPLVAVLEFLQFLWTNLPTASVVNFGGRIVAWFGPKTGGEQ